MASTMAEYELEALPELEGIPEAPELGGVHELQQEWEASLGELEGEYEWETEANPIRRVYPDALMEHLGHAAAEAATEAEAEAFIGALVPLAAQVLPRVAPAIMRAAPRLLRGASRITRTLRRTPAGRRLVRTMPSILRRTVASVGRQSAAGRPVTPQTATRALVQQTRRVLANPAVRQQVLRRSRVLDRRYHRSPAAVTTSIRVINRVCPTCQCCGGPVSRTGPGISTSRRI